MLSRFPPGRSTLPMPWQKRVSPVKRMCPNCRQMQPGVCPGVWMIVPLRLPMLTVSPPSSRTSGSSEGNCSGWIPKTAGAVQ